ncbi:hypothetical protein [Sphingobium sp. Z007]|uniref:hypothetical protein n=1 Tax=Sphingobium sp. Z007 TaxID=627495 RepID=UPI001124DF41|nr:hypothetical protein [Sphingobium sp. Z007]
MDVRDEMQFRAELSVRYHRRRASFLDRTSQLMTLTSLIGGAAAFASLIGDPNTIFAKWATLIITALTLIQSVFRIDAAAAEHKMWLREWSKLLLNIRQNEHPTEAQIGEWMHAQTELDSSCVSEMRALEADCWNRTTEQMGYNDAPARVSWYHKLFGQVWSFENGDFSPKTSKQHLLH